MAVVAKHQDLIDELLAELEPYKEFKPELDLELIAHAFEFAAAAHDGQLRRS